MPNYFLSYIEVNRHAAMMLSVQDDDSQAIKIDREIGFATKEDEIDKFARQAGEVRYETNASMAKYSKKTKVMHKTWQISQEERDRLINIVERDMMDGKQAGGEVGTPEYQYFALNCKYYILGVLKELGMAEEAVELKNFLVQIPGSTPDKLKKLEGAHFEYPNKELFTETLTGKIEEINFALSFFEDNEEYIEVDIADPEANTIFLNLVKEVKETAKRLEEMKDKAGFDLKYFALFLKLQKQIDRLSTYQNLVTWSEPNSPLQDRVDEFFETFKTMENPIFREKTLKKWRETINFILINKDNIDFTTSPKGLDRDEALIYSLKVNSAIESILNNKEYESRSYLESFINLEEGMAKLSEYFEYPELLEFNDDPDKQEILQEGLNSLNFTENAFSDLMKDHYALINEDRECKTQMFWSKPPELSKRAALHGFDEIEKKIYFRNYQASEIDDGLDDIINIIKKQLEVEKDEDHKLDLTDLKEIVSVAKNQAKQSHQDYLESVKNKNASEVNFISLHEGEKLKNICIELKDNIKNFKPRAPQKTNIIIRLIDNLLDFFSIKPFDKTKANKTLLNQNMQKLFYRLHGNREEYEKKSKNSVPAAKQTKPVRPSKSVMSLFPKKSNKEIEKKPIRNHKRSRKN